MTKNIYLKLGNTIAYLAMIVANILANVLPLGGMKTSQISAMYPTIFTPPGITFGIWGVIYILLGIFVVSQYFEKANIKVDEIGPYFIISCVLNTVWIFAWQYQKMVLASITIMLLLLSLLQIYSLTRTHNPLIRISFSIYYAWITVATIASVFILVKTLTGNAPVTPIEPRTITPFSPSGYTGIIIAEGDPMVVSYVSTVEYIFAGIALFATALLTMQHIALFGDVAYTATILWAFGGIAYKLFTSNVIPVYMLIMLVLGIMIIGFALLTNIDDLVIIKTPMRMKKVDRSVQIRKEGMKL